MHLFTPVDINECQTNRGGCEHNCTNTEGSFNCLCQRGFILASDGLQCDGKIHDVFVTVSVFEAIKSAIIIVQTLTSV